MLSVMRAEQVRERWHDVTCAERSARVSVKAKLTALSQGHAIAASVPECREDPRWSNGYNVRCAQLSAFRLDGDDALL